ncbi:MAG: PadR family transcriptional regulator [Thermoprotei archaeon]|nr:MAG: PadR family transcriptional regulator [Thermoprotei archaeon]
MKEVKPIRRLKRKLGIEVLWLFLLSQLAEGDSYAYELIKFIEEKYGFNPGKVLPYVVLKRLENEGYVESYLKDKRKYYRLTPQGIALLKEGIAYIKLVLNNLEKSLTEDI